MGLIKLIKKEAISTWAKETVLFSLMMNMKRALISFTSLILDQYYKRPQWMGGSVALGCEGSQELNKHLILNLIHYPSFPSEQSCP